MASSSSEVTEPEARSAAASGHFLFGGDVVASSSPIDGDLSAFRVGTAVRVQLLVPGRAPSDLPVADGWSAAWAPYDHAPGVTEVIGYDRRGFVIGRVAVFHADGEDVNGPPETAPATPAD